LPDLKYAVIFSAVDQLTDKLSSFGGGFLNLGNQITDVGSKIGEAGESLTRFGERLSLDTMLMKDGADRLRELSDTITEPAFAAQKSLQTLAAMTGLSNTELAKLKETAIDFSNTHPGVTTEQWIDGLTRMRGIFQDTNKAIEGEDTAAMLSRFGIDGAAATNILGVAYANLGVDAAKTGDQLIKTVQLFGLAPDRAQQLAMAIGNLGGTAKQTNTPLSELLALAGEASAEKGFSGRGAMQFASMVREMVKASDEGKSSIVWSNGLSAGLSQLRDSINGLPTSEKMETLSKMGVSDPGAMITFLDGLDQVAAKQRAIASGAGALGAAFKTATSDASDQLALMHQNVTTLYDTIASPSLPWFTTQFQRLTSVAQETNSLAAKYPETLGAAVDTLSGLSTGAYFAVSALSTLGSASIFLGQGLRAISWLTGISDMETFALKGMYAWDAISNLTIGTKAWAAAQWLVNYAMEANPIGLVIAGAVALAAVAYEVYEHWGAVRGMLTSFGTWAEGWAKTLGKIVLMGIAGPFGMIAGEIYSHWDSIRAACEKIGSGIKDFFVGHSPPPVGPLHELGNITISETIADKIRPAPVLAAIRRTAAAAAIASTTVIAAGAGAAMAGPTSTGPGAQNGVAPISFNFAPVINGTKLTKEELLEVLSKSAHEVARILERYRETKERTVLS
jgi:hypothetical protein